MPEIIYGTQRLDGADAKKMCALAWEYGVRAFDTALAYDNAASLKGFFTFLEDRRACRVITKITQSHIANHGVRGAATSAIKDLGLEYVDVLLIHAPKNVDHIAVLAEMEDLKGIGLIRAHGVSNYTIRHLKKILGDGVKPDIIQNEIHPFLQESDLVSFCQENHIEVLAHSAFANGKVFQDSDLRNMAGLSGLSVGRMCLEWAIVRNISPVVSTVDPGHLKGLFMGDITGLPSAVIEAMRGMDRDMRLCDNPAWAEFD